MPLALSTRPCASSARSSWRPGCRGDLHQSSRVSENSPPSSTRTPASSSAVAPSQPNTSMSKAPRPPTWRQPLAQLGRARTRVGATDVLVALAGRRQRGAARGALGRHDELALAAVAQRHDRADDLGDDVAGLAQHDHVTDQHALALDLVLVVQRRHLDGGPGHADGLHDAVRRDPAGATDVDRDVEQPGVDLLGRVLPGDGPPRRPRGGAEPTLQCDLVDLDDDAVDLVHDVVAVLAVVGDELLDRLEVVTTLARSLRGQAPGLERVVGLALPLGLKPSR